jgi:dihydrofolate synthase/folylpolyglutamate synthase
VNYRDALAWLYGSQTFGIKLGLDNTRRLLAAAGEPQERLKFLHVAGTNGKGSTCAMIDAVLRAAGYRTGLYTSPHLVDFRERLRLDGVMIPEAAATEGLTMLRDAAQSWDHAPTFFEIATVLAAWWFDREGAEFVVWETGMGGRLDATNAVMPVVSVLTPVGMDHEMWLGETLAKIAAEKAGILKPGVPAVSAPQRPEVRSVIEARAAGVGAPLEFITAPWEAGPVGLAGVHQKWNAALAWSAVQAAGMAVDRHAAQSGLAGVVWPGRFQRIGSDLVIDGAHNPAAVEALVATWREVFGTVPAHLVFGALRDKDVGEILRLLRSLGDEIWLVPISTARGASVVELRPAAEAAGFKVVHESTVEEAVPAIRQSGTPALVTGSLFLAGEVLAFLEGSPKPLATAQ